ncbi:prenyltransferase/squalene oxidase repeat-containing protein [Streptomyces sp. NPDC002520]
MRVPHHRPQLPFWSRELFPAHLHLTTSRLKDRLIAAVDADGALRDPCRSRVLESALCLRLLERSGLEPEAGAGLVTYLDARRESTVALDRLLVSAALDDPAHTAEPLMGDFLARAPRFTSRRKQVMIDAVLSVFGAPMPEPDPRAFSSDGLHPWAKVQVASLKVISFRALNRAEAIDARDWELLLSTQNLPDVWEGNILIHLSVLHALVGLPDTAGTVAHGVRQVLRHQRPDGGLPFVTDTDTWCTATGGVALAAAKAPAPVLHRIAGHLVRQQRPDGGWAYTDLAQQTDADDISVATEFLHTLDANLYRPQIAASLECLRRLAGPDGGFPTYAGAPAEACMTAAAVNALGVEGPANHKTLREGIRFLALAQNPDGTFAPDWSASTLHTVFRTVLATGQEPTAASSEATRLRQRCLDLIRAAQNTDGGWGWATGHPSDALSTSYALIALCAQQDPEPAARAARYLLCGQQENGSIPSISDSIGPRPFIFQVPLLADIFAMLALGHLASRLAPVEAEHTAQTGHADESALVH